MQQGEVPPILSFSPLALFDHDHDYDHDHDHDYEPSFIKFYQSIEKDKI